jgi:RHS repeat-associated protein
VPTSTQSSIYDAMDFPQNVVPKSSTNQGDAPKAFLNYMYFDRQMNFLTSGFQQISTAAQLNREYVELDLPVFAQDGYVMVYVSNESDVLNYVHFDDFSIYHAKTNVVSAQSYYPFGGTFGEFNRSFSTPQRHRYNAGSELNVTLNIYETLFRGYDPILGRFLQIDPLADIFTGITPYNYAFNSPVNLNDPYGLGPFDWLKRLFRGFVGDQASPQARRSQKQNNAQGVTRGKPNPKYPPNQPSSNTPSTASNETNRPKYEPPNLTRKEPDWGLPDPGRDLLPAPVFNYPSTVIDKPVVKNRPDDSKPFRSGDRIEDYDNQMFHYNTPYFQDKNSVQKRLSRLYSSLNSNPDLKVVISGCVLHKWGNAGVRVTTYKGATDVDGLAMDRAEAVRQVLIDMGVNPSQIQIGAPRYGDIHGVTAPGYFIKVQ